MGPRPLEAFNVLKSHLSLGDLVTYLKTNHIEIYVMPGGKVCLLSKTDAYLLNAKNALIHGQGLEQDGFREARIYDWFRDLPGAVSKWSDLYKQNELLKPELGLKKTPLSVLDSMRGAGLDTGVLQQDSWGNLSFKTWEGKYHTGSDYSWKEPDKILEGRLEVITEKNRHFFKSRGLEELVSRDDGVKAQVEHMFKLNGWDPAPASKDIQLIKGLWTTLNPAEFDRLFVGMQQNEYLHKFLVEQMAKGDLHLLQLDHLV